MSKTITTILLLAVIIAGGIWLFNRNDGDVALEPTPANAEDMTGTGGPEEGFDPLGEEIQPKG